MKNFKTHLECFSQSQCNWQYQNCQTEACGCQIFLKGPSIYYVSTFLVVSGFFLTFSRISWTFWTFLDIFGHFRTFLDIFTHFSGHLWTFWEIFGPLKWLRDIWVVPYPMSSSINMKSNKRETGNRETNWRRNKAEYVSISSIGNWW